MTDFFIVEEIQKMIKGLPKPRLLFKKGVTVKGYFRPYMSLKDYTRAAIFKDPDEITPVTVRFSSLLGDKGTADTRRNIKSMAVKFHSYDKVYDVICQNIPVWMTYDIDKLIEVTDIFHIRDHFDGIDSENFWTFVTDHKESITYAMMLYSHMGLSDSFININMFSVNTYLWNEDDNNFHLVRYKWMPVSDKNKTFIDPNKVMTVNAAEFIAGYDPDRAVNEIVANILNNKFPTFELHIQMLDGNKTADDRYMDKTLLWNETEAPYMCAGIMVLDKIEEDVIDDPAICFLPNNTVEGIELCTDEISQILDFLFRTEAMERGACL